MLRSQTSDHALCGSSAWVCVFVCMCCDLRPVSVLCAGLARWGCEFMLKSQSSDHASCRSCWLSLCVYAVISDQRKCFVRVLLADFVCLCICVTISDQWPCYVRVLLAEVMSFMFQSQSSNHALCGSCWLRVCDLRPVTMLHAHSKHASASLAYVHLCVHVCVWA